MVADNSVSLGNAKSDFRDGSGFFSHAALEQKKDESFFAEAVFMFSDKMKGSFYSILTIGLPLLFIGILIQHHYRMKEGQEKYAIQEKDHQLKFQKFSENLMMQIDTLSSKLDEKTKILAFLDDEFPDNSALVVANENEIHHGAAKKHGRVQEQIDVLTAKVDQGIVENVHGTMGGNLAAYENVGGFRFNLDFLYWQAKEDGLEFGTEIVTNPAGAEPAQVTTKLLDLHFDWDPGFCVGIGYLFDHYDNWSLDLNWTYMRNKARGNATAGGIESMTGTTSTIISPWVNLLFEPRDGASQANARWDINYNVLDLDLGRSFFVSKQVALNPFIGVRGALINQDYKVNYSTIVLTGDGGPRVSRVVTFKGDNDFGGIGLRGGSEVLWQFGKHWNLFGEISGSLLIGKFRVKMKNLNDQGLDHLPLNFFASEKFWRVRLNMEEAIGFGWETFFCRNQYHVAIKAAYELSQWLSQNELFYTFYFRGADTISSVPVRNQGNLGFHGIKVGVHFDF